MKYIFITFANGENIIVMKRILNLLILALLLGAPMSDMHAQSKKDKIVMPEYPGGQAALHKFLLSELEYPAEAKANNEIGEVLVAFSVGIDGYISGVRVLKSVSPSLDAEAMRVVKKMKYWRPGSRNGNPVRAEMSIPINFKTVKEHNKFIDNNSDYMENMFKDI